MDTTDAMTPYDRLDTFLAEGRIIRGAWTGEKDGRKTACILATLSPEVAEEHDADACPTALMPAWMAHLTVWLGDSPTSAHWPEVVGRYALLVRRFPALDAAGWERAGYRVGAAIMRCAPPGMADEWGCHAATTAMIAAFDRAANGEMVARKEWEDLAARATQAVRVANAALAPAEAAWAAWAAARAARAAAEAAWVAEEAAWAAEVAEAVEVTRADKIADTILSALESERRDKQRGHDRRHAGFNERWDSMSHGDQRKGLRNKRDVWTIASEPTHDAHFATFPRKLVEPCILAGCPPGGLVLDPFGGSGTVGRVAEDLGRKWLLFDLNHKYATIAARKTAQVGLLGRISP